MTLCLTKKRRQPATLLDAFFNFPVTAFDTLEPFQHSYPATNIRETADIVEIELELAGFHKKDIQIHYKDGSITIEGEKHDAADAKDSQYRRREIRSGRVYRQIQVGQIDFDRSTAKYTDGILQLSLPKSAERQEKRLSIQ